MKCFYQERHSPLRLIIEHGVVPRVRDADAIDGEQPGGGGIQLPGTCLNVVLCVILYRDFSR